MANCSPTVMWALTEEETAKVEEIRARALARAPAGGGRRSGPRNESLRSDEPTHRELDVLEMLALGMSDGEIAAALYVARETVKSHQRSLRSKLDARSRTHLVAIAIRRGFIQ